MLNDYLHHASLPWYDLEEIQPATDVFWSILSRYLRREGFQRVPSRLNRSMPYWKQWSSPHLLLSQACGYDVVNHGRARLQPVLTPVYSAPGCQGGTYSSYVIVREDSPFQTLDELRGHRCAINTPTSHSGMNILRALVAPLHVEGRFFSCVRVSGAHVNSLSMILNRKVEVAAIDCVIYALLKRHRPEAISGTRIICQSLPYPAPPYVTSASASQDDLRRLQAAILEALDSPAVWNVKEDLFLSRAEITPPGTYRSIDELEAWALAHGYTEFNWAWRLGIRRGTKWLGPRNWTRKTGWPMEESLTESARPSSD